MPTYNRRRFVPQAIKYFLEQDYQNKELIIIDDGSDRIEDLIPDDPLIRYIALDRKLTIGEKRNLAIENSNSEIILHGDDDDWQARHRISYQVREMLTKKAEICGTSRLFFYDLRSKKLWLYTYPFHKKKWLAGEVLCYTKKFWRARKFDDVNIGEDTRFVWKHVNERMLNLESYDFCVAIVHLDNVCPKSLSGQYWHEQQNISIKDIIGNDWDFYFNFNNS